MIHIVCNDVVAASIQVSRIKGKEDLVCSTELVLSVGRLSETYDSQYRRELITQMFAYSSPDVFTAGTNMDDFFDRNVTSIHAMLSRAEMGEPILIWADPDVEGVCSIALVCSLLSDAKKTGKIYILECPRTVVTKEYFAKAKGWATMPQDGLHQYLQDKREMDGREFKYYTDLWERLVRDNRTLRVMVAGALISVEDDFCDKLILEYISDKPRSENHIMGELLGNTGIEISTLLLPWRIEELIKQGKVEVVSEAPQGSNFSARKFRRTK